MPFDATPKTRTFVCQNCGETLGVRVNNSLVFEHKGIEVSTEFKKSHMIFHGGCGTKTLFSVENRKS